MSHQPGASALDRVTTSTILREIRLRRRNGDPGDEYERLKLLVPDPYDCILSKLQRAGLKDSDAALFLFQSRKLKSEIPRERYHRELRDYLIGPLERHDQALERWIEIFESRG